MDSDYDAMIAHVGRHEVRVSRHASIAELPFLAAAKPHVPDRPADRFAQFVAHLKAHSNNRPKGQATLLTHIRDFQPAPWGRSSAHPVPPLSNCS